jgi:head-tail adaptor
MAGPEKGNQRFPVTIQQAPSTDATEDSGFPSEEWTTLATNVWMSRRSLSGDERFTAGQLSSKAQLEWGMSYRADMDPDLVDVPKLRRLVYQGATYDILSADHVGRKDGVTMITLSR